MPDSQSPPRARPVQYKAPLGTRWEKEKAVVPKGAFDLLTDPNQIGPWILGECVGKGASGRVKVARHCETGQMAAVKILPLENVLSSRHSLNTRATKAEKHRNGIDKEIIMMKLMDHPNIVRIYDVFEGERDLFLVLEYVDGGELFDYLVNHGRMDPHKALCYFKQIVFGLAYAHAFAVIHRDLKPENILIASLNPPHIKIADWGMAAFAPPDHRLETSCGSPHYASPEIVRGERYSGTATDIWSCGVILFALMTGRLPFDDKSIRALLQKVKSGKFEIPTYVHAEAADLIRRMLVVDVEKRITMPDILAHPFLSHSTSGVITVSPPSISELDRPLRSSSLIKKDLISSLLLICVGATYHELVAELFSPPGQGSLTKALYFLLSRHRERTLEEYGMQSLFCNDGQTIRHYPAPPMKGGPKPESEFFLDPRTVPAGHPSHPGQVLLASRQAPRAPRGSLDTAHDQPEPPISPPSSRIRPTSPSGPCTPRPSQLSKVRPVSSPASTRNTCSDMDVVTAKNSRVVAEATPDTVSRQTASRVSTRRRTHTVDGLPLSQQRYDPAVGSSAPGTPVEGLYPGSPRGQAQAPVLPPLNVTVESEATPVADALGGIPWLEKPKVEDPALKRTLDDIERRLGVLMKDQQKQGQLAVGLGLGAAVTGGSVDFAIDASSCMVVDDEHRVLSPKRLRLGDPNEVDFRYSLPNKKTTSLDQGAHGDGHDKENLHCGSPHLVSSRTSGQDRSEDDDSYTKIEKADVEGEVAAADARMAAHKRTRKHREKMTHAANKRHTYTASEPVNQGSSLVTPEVKGWFSNLFNWKAQQYVLHSIDNCLSTRDEATRILQSLGCHVVLEDAQGWGVLKCKMEEMVDSSTGMVTMKSVRFRAEFNPIVGYTQHVHTTSSPAPSSPNDTSEVGTPSAPLSIPKRMSTKNAAPFASTLVLVQEKGALSTFRHVHSRLRSDWRGRDALRSPEIGGTSTPMVSSTPRLR